jgi:hypothetical protein
MNADLLKLMIAVLASTGTAYSAIRADLAELKVTSAYSVSRIEKIEHRLEK